MCCWHCNQSRTKLRLRMCCRHLTANINTLICICLKTHTDTQRYISAWETPHGITSVMVVCVCVYVCKNSRWLSAQMSFSTWTWLAFFLVKEDLAMLDWAASVDELDTHTRSKTLLSVLDKKGETNSCGSFRMLSMDAQQYGDYVKLAWCSTQFLSNLPVTGS